ncbi:MAG: hypothetical protein ABI604_18665, partial [Nitrospirota bacterium]
MIATFGWASPQVFVAPVPLGDHRAERSIRLDSAITENLNIARIWHRGAVRCRIRIRHCQLRNVGTKRVKYRFSTHFPITRTSAVNHRDVGPPWLDHGACKDGRPWNELTATER